MTLFSVMLLNRSLEAVEGFLRNGSIKVVDALVGFFRNASDQVLGAFESLVRNIAYKVEQAVQDFFQFLRK